MKGPDEEIDTREVRLPVSVDLPLAIGIPVEYIPDQNLRLKLYRRLADLEREPNWMHWWMNSSTALARCPRRCRT